MVEVEKLYPVAAIATELAFVTLQESVEVPTERTSVGEAEKEETVGGFAGALTVSESVASS
jgi:hypothetical protein